MESDLRPEAAAPLVLIVEDDESNRELFQLVLERAGMRVMTVRDVDQARSVTTRVTPDAIVTDVRMPLRDGLTFIRALHDNPALEAVPILFVTGFLLSTDDLRSIEKHGPVEAVLKPFQPDLLVEFVESLLARARRRTGETVRPRATDRASRPKAAARTLTETAQDLVDDAKALLRAKTVLLVEDDGAFRYAVGRMLRGAGAEVIETTTLENALSALNERPEIEAIVADVVLPDGLAPDGLKRFEQQRRLPVLYVTGYSEHLLRDYGLSARDPHLLLKPFDAATLVARLAALGA